MTLIDVRAEADGKPAISLARWADLVPPPTAETQRSRTLAHVGGLAAVAGLLGYLAWRILATLPSGGSDLTVAWLLIAFEALPLTGLVLKTWTLWRLDTPVPPAVTEVPGGMH
ncbi:MAG: hypothetical protein ACRDO2_09580, partial [Nocardioidaceae bacterium]